MKIKSNTIIRRIEESDKGDYLKLFNDENFGCTSIHSDLKPPIYEEERIISGIIEKSIIDEEVLVIEDKGEFIGYASISRPTEHNYHIGQFVIRKDKQRQGYGTMLMQQIKKYASSEDCSITLECISSATNFFQKIGFCNTYSSTFKYPRKKTIKRRKKLFPDYELIKKQRDNQTQQEIESFQKFLSSPLFKEIMKL